MRGARLALVLAAVVLLATDSAVAANYAQETLDRYFRIEYQVAQSASHPVVSGYVYNLNPGNPAERMQLSLEGLDASDKAAGTSPTWALGTGPAANRAYFTTAVTPSRP